jgi:hypothetical protein
MVFGATPRRLENDTRLYNLQTDPGQDSPLHDSAVEEQMRRLMAELMAENDAPAEAFRRIGLSAPETEAAAV